MSDPLRDVDEAARKEPSSEAKYWGKELELARKRQSKYRKEAEEVVKIYEGDVTGENSFNILYSNTETLLPAIYNQLPRPDVDRSNHDEDPLGKEGAETLERVIKQIIDSQDAEYDQAHRLFQQAVLGGLVPGQGVTRWFYDAEIETKTIPVGDTGGEEDQGADAAAQDEESLPFVPERTRSRVNYESICGKDLDYDQVLYGYARRWIDVPWVGFEHFMQMDDLKANFPGEYEDIKIAPYSKPDQGEWKSGDEVEYGDKNHGSQPGAYVIEIWNKARKEVVFYCETYPEKLIGEARDDPYNLSGFYPIPEPLKFQMKTSGVVPKPLYKLYEAQAKELNRLSVRINKILNAMKVRGFYDGSVGDLKGLLDKPDNTMIPAQNASAFYEGKTLDNAIWLMPLEKLVTVLQQLLMGREQCKNTIYEITGISDIMRGDTQASETYGAQKLKSKWGTSRLQKFQGEVQRYCRDSFRIIAELAAKNFGPRTFQKMTNLDYATDEEVQQAQMVLQQVQMMQARMAAMGSPPAFGGFSGGGAGPGGAPEAGAPPPPGAPPDQGAQPPGPPPPPPIPPEVQQAVEQAQAVLQKPKWSDVIGLLQSDIDREYRIDIETNSTIDPTRQEDKQDIIDVMNALANTAESFGPFVEQGVFPMPAFKSMLLAITRRFTFGREVEEQIKAIPDEVPQTPNNTPAPPGGGGASKAPPSPEELQAKQLEGQNALAKAQAEQSLIGARAQFEQDQLTRDNARQQREEERAVLEHQLEMEGLKAKISTSQIMVDQKRQAAEVAGQAKERDAAISTHQLLTQGMIAQDQARQQGAIKNEQAATAGAIATKRSQDAATIATKRERMRPPPGGNGKGR